MKLLVLLAASSFVAAQNSDTPGTCFFPAGNVAHNNVPCNPSAAASHCCSKASQCLDNGLCKVNTDEDTDEFARGACTDKTWQSPECFQHCKSSQPGSPDTNGAAIFECGTVGFINPATYCCENGINHKTSCCSTSSLLFQLGPGSTTFGSMPTSSAAPSLPVTTATALTTTITTPTAASSTPISDLPGITAISSSPSSSAPLGTAPSTFLPSNSSSSPSSPSAPPSPPIQTGGAAILGARDARLGVGVSVGMMGIVGFAMALL